MRHPRRLEERRVSAPLGLGLRLEPSSSVRAVSALNLKAVSPTPLYPLIQLLTVHLLNSSFFLQACLSQSFPCGREMCGPGVRVLMKILNGNLLEAGLCVGMQGLDGRKNLPAKKKRDSGEIRTSLGWISLTLDHPSVQAP